MGYIMRGNISVTDDNSGDGESLQQAVGDSDIVGVPLRAFPNIQVTYRIEFSCNSLMRNFQDLRGGQSGTGDEQTLIVWRVPSEMQMSSVISQLSEFSSELPYS